MAHDAQAGAQGCVTSEAVAVDMQRPGSPGSLAPRSPAVCLCIACRAIAAAGALADCPECSGRRFDDCGSCGGTGDGDREGRTLCCDCMGSGAGDECDACSGSGRLVFAACALCGHYADEHDLKADVPLTAARGSLAMLRTCGECSPCMGCDRSAHESVADAEGRCLACQGAEARLREPTAMERFLADDRALETVEAAIFAGLVVSGLVALVLALGAWVARMLRQLPGGDA